MLLVHLVLVQKGPSTCECCSWGSETGSSVPLRDTHRILQAQTFARASREGRILGEAQLHPSCQLTARCHSGDLFIGAKPLIILLEGAPESSFRFFICSVNEMLDARLPTLKPDCIGRWWSWGGAELSFHFQLQQVTKILPGFCKLYNSRHSFQGDSDGLGLPEQPVTGSERRSLCQSHWSFSF